MDSAVGITLQLALYAETACAALFMYVLSTHSVLFESARCRTEDSQADQPQRPESAELVTPAAQASVCVNTARAVCIKA